MGLPHSAFLYFAVIHLLHQESISSSFALSHLSQAEWPRREETRTFGIQTVITSLKRFKNVGSNDLADFKYLFLRFFFNICLKSAVFLWSQVLLRVCHKGMFMFQITFSNERKALLCTFKTIMVIRINSDRRKLWHDIIHQIFKSFEFICGLCKVKMLLLQAYFGHKLPSKIRFKGLFSYHFIFFYSKSLRYKTNVIHLKNTR